MASPRQIRDLANRAAGVETEEQRDMRLVLSSDGHVPTTFEAQVRDEELRHQREIMEGHGEARPGETPDDVKRREKSNNLFSRKSESSNPLSTIFSAVSSVVSAPINFLNSAWDKATDFVSNVGSGVSRFAENAWDVTTDFASAAGQRLEQGFNFVSSLPGRLGRFAENKFDMFTDTTAAPAPALRARGPALEPILN